MKKAVGLIPRGPLSPRGSDISRKLAADPVFVRDDPQRDDGGRCRQVRPYRQHLSGSTGGPQGQESAVGDGTTGEDDGDTGDLNSTGNPPACTPTRRHPRSARDPALLCKRPCLLRRYVGKRTNLAVYNHADLGAISYRIHAMPRRIHHWSSAAECYNAAVVALTA